MNRIKPMNKKTFWKIATAISVGILIATTAIDRSMAKQSELPGQFTRAPRVFTVGQSEKKAKLETGLLREGLIRNEFVRETITKPPKAELIEKQSKSGTKKAVSK